MTDANLKDNSRNGPGEEVLPPREIHDNNQHERRYSHYDFSKVEMPFNNFMSLQESKERERNMADTTTVGTL